jgi:hypothetical protein
LDGTFNLMRQHSAKNPYGKFTKAIRFDGIKFMMVIVTQLFIILLSLKYTQINRN